MAHAYTPGLRVTPRARLLRERRLPLAGQVLVEREEAVEAGTVVARTELPGEVTTLAVANQLGIDNGDLVEVMLVKQGGAVQKGQVVARGGGFLGMFKQEVRSTLTGTVENVSKVTGQVLLRGQPEPLTVDAYVRGTVAEVIEREGVVVRAEGAFLQGIFGIGGETRGKVQVRVDAPEKALEPAAIGADAAGAVLIGGAYASLKTIRRAIEVKAAALVVGGVGYADITELLGRPIGVAVTGSEDVGLTLVLTEGFGHIPMAVRTFALLQASAGKEASVNGATQIRAGVIRPEILVPVASGAPGEAAPDPEPRGVEAGSAVRIIREPYFGEIGLAHALPPELRKLDTETLVRVAEIKLRDGRVVTVPRSNLELLEG